ncbi:zinc finger protein 771-like [Cydia strobilella]|uniref:zinc finger protein 771-like n=1 Tax=Cydia strobilella TaxID=1100964 RepID=UPI00300721EA
MYDDSYDNVCRICFQRQDTIFSLFRKQKGSSPYDKLVKHTKLKIALDDGGPASICLQCLTDLDTTINFLNKCEKSNEILAIRNYEKKEVSNLECGVPNDIVCFSQEESVDSELIRPVKGSVDNQGGKHIELVTESVQCPQCGSKRRCKHWAPPMAHTCQYCQKVFTRKFNYTLHLKRHLGERDWPCPICGALLLTRWLATRHCRRPRKACPVPGCDKTFTTNTNLATHVRTHSGERPHDCPECGKSFSCKNTLNDHIRIHTGVKPYICPVCGKLFATNKLSTHILSHTTSRPHACAAPGCARAFKSRRALTLHVATHEHRRAHKCSVCGNRYNHTQSLNKHMKRHAQKSITTDNVQIDHSDI